MLQTIGVFNMYHCGASMQQFNILLSPRCTGIGRIAPPQQNCEFHCVQRLYYEYETMAFY